MTEKLRSNRTNSFCENQKNSKNGCFLAIFGLILIVSHIPVIRFRCHCTYRTLIWCRMTVKNFVRIVWTVFAKIKEKSKNGCFLPIFGLILVVSHIPGIRFRCHCTYRTLIWCRMTVINFVRIVWTVFAKIEKVEKWLFLGYFWPLLG